MDLQELLSDIGLSEREAKTYLALLELGSATLKPVADKAGIKRTSIYNFIERLISLGLVEKAVTGGRAQYQAASPSKLLTLQRERLARIDDALPELMARFNRHERKPRVRLFEGPEQMRNMVIEETTCRKEALYIWTGREMIDMVGGVEFMTHIDRTRIKKGVQVRTVRFREKDLPFKTSAHGAAQLRELRFAPLGVHFSMGLGIYDTGKVGFFSSQRESFGIMIESKELEQLMRGLYEYFWQRCEPARKGEG